MRAQASQRPSVDDDLTPDAFAAYHMAALERHEDLNTVLLGILGSGVKASHAWTLGAPGQCAMQVSGRNIVLGDLTERQCRALATQTVLLDYPGVVGPGLTARWFVEQAASLGHWFGTPMPQMIHSMSAAPKYSGAAGSARISNAVDSALIYDWACAFVREAIPHEPLPNYDACAQRAADGYFVLWTIDDVPVSMVGIGRRTRNAAGIAPVYTPPRLRGRGYAASAVAATVERIYAQGKTMATLYTDLRNPSSNRCYENVGFRPIAPSLHYARIAAVDGRPRATAGS